MVGLESEQQGIERAGARLVGTRGRQPDALPRVRGPPPLRRRRPVPPPGDGDVPPLRLAVGELGLDAHRRRDVGRLPARDRGRRRPRASSAEIEARLQRLASPFRTAEATGQDIIDPRDAGRSPSSSCTTPSACCACSSANRRTATCRERRSRAAAAGGVRLIGACGPGGTVGRMSEAVLEPDLPICDAHHHLWLARGPAPPYTLDELRADTGTRPQRRADRVRRVPLAVPHRRSGRAAAGRRGRVGASVAEEADRRGDGPPIAGIVGHADLTLGDCVRAGPRGARRGRATGGSAACATTRPGTPAPMGNNADRGRDPGRGRLPATACATLGRLGSRSTRWRTTRSSPSSPTLAGLPRRARSSLDHLGIPLGGGPYRGRADEVRAQWRAGMTELAGVRERRAEGRRADPTARRRQVGQAAGRAGHVRGDRGGVGRRDPLRHRRVRPVALHVRVELPGRQGVLRLRRGVERVQAARRRLQRRTSERDLFHDTAARAYRLPTLAA